MFFWSDILARAEVKTQHECQAHHSSTVSTQCAPSQEVEPELLLSKNLLVSRLEETSSKFQEVDLESYSSLEV